MSDSSSLTNENSANDEQRESHNDIHSAALLARIVEVENLVKAAAANTDANSKKQTTDEELLGRVKTAERWMIVLTGLIFAVSVFQACESWSNNQATGKQVEQIIVAGHRLEDAGDSFSTSSANMSRSMDDAVKQLGTQAANIESARKSSVEQSEKNLAIATKNAQSDLRPYLVADATPDQSVICQDGMYPYDCAYFSYSNAGRTPAVYIKIEAERVNEVSRGPGVEVRKEMKDMVANSRYTGLEGAALGVGHGQGKVTIVNPGAVCTQGYHEHACGHFLFGIIQYKDIFDNFHETGFCNYFSHQADSAARACDFGNWFDVRPTEYPQLPKKK